MTAADKATLLILNSGSSSLKFRLYGLTPDLPFLLGGKVMEIGGDAVFQAHDEEHSRDDMHPLQKGAAHAEALEHVLDWVAKASKDWHLAGAAHRIVHGGTRYHHSVRLDADAIAYLDSLCPLAPLHQPHNLAAVKALAAAYPDLPQYGCFDTAFHADHSRLTSDYALPRWLRDKGVRRYGFHGLSYQWIAEVLKRDHPHLHAGRVVVAHLGNGASLCAMKGGASIDTTMGMTALEGLPMGTRSGSVDPGVILYMLQTLDMSADDVSRVLYEESGLKGLSGISSDVKLLQDSTAENARFALDYFAFRVAQNVAAQSISIGGMDGLVFTGGIGEHAEPVRKAILGHLAVFSAFETLVIPANEERAMALDVMAFFQQETAAWHNP